ncbi:hypothetical protein EYZ11_005483 [Aspergillus tanneri]|uniref:PKS/mFAS DH domain-containing protein n=1 Tax=Aspergillus tanneri TaxID=1220188 RepID=A0A4S3JIG8_9EURO|nr:hypothetical protein EYZ11_005483 [Aspergillus tanneri]
MAGEAIRQVTRSMDYSIRHLLIKTALVLKGSDPVELVTALKPAKLADDVDSLWYDFTIVAYQNDRWRKHCVGQVRSGPDKDHKPEQAQAYQRRVHFDSWYNALRKRGLNYGKQFRRLRDITASTLQHEAAALIQDDLSFHADYYALHPILIDNGLQLFSVAATQGIIYQMTRLCVPTAIEALYVNVNRDLTTLNALSRTTGGTMTGNSILSSGSNVILSMQGVQFTSFQSTELANSDALLASQLQWKPDIDLLPVEVQLPKGEKNVTFGQLVAKLFCGHIAEAYWKTRSSVPASEHLQRYLAWIERQYRRIQDKDPDLLPEMKEPIVHKLVMLERYQDQLLEDAQQGEQYTKSLLVVHGIADRILSSIHNILEGRINPLELLLRDDGLKRLYEDVTIFPGWNTFFTLLGHSNPTLRVLEIGAGTGGSTSIALKALTTPNGCRLYSTYTFTDISPGFLPKAKARFQSYSGIDYKVLDISRDPEAQGFELGCYDLIIASNVLHATPRISQALRNVRRLIAPGGRLLIMELCNVVPVFEFIMGVLPGWWIGEEEARKEKPTMPPQEWHNALLNAGFTGAELVRYDNEVPYQMTATMLSRPQTVHSSSHRTKIGLLYRSSVTQWGRILERELSIRGYEVYWHTLHQTPYRESQVISLLDLEGPFFEDLSSDEFSLFQTYLSKLTGGHILWVTKSLQMACEDPRFALVLGTARTIRQEMGHDMSTLEIDNLNSGAEKFVIEILEKLRTQKENRSKKPDYEFALQDGTVHVGRYAWSFLKQHAAAATKTLGPRVVDIDTHGVLETLTWALGDTVPQQMGEEDVEVDIKYVGLNFRVRVLPSMPHLYDCQVLTK